MWFLGLLCILLAAWIITMMPLTLAIIIAAIIITVAVKD